MNEYQRMIKRGFDLLLTAFAMPFLLPVMGLIVLAIRLESLGPAIFCQKRVGENGVTFEMFKFRSMKTGSEGQYAAYEMVDVDEKVHQIKLPKDPRVTRVGRFLRRSSLDELPQIFNVLRGDMSWVGPRPELPRWVDRYEPWQRQRLSVPQGITGWWQVNGRSDRPMFEHTEDDIYYVQHYSFWLDLMILWRTVGVVLQGKGAY